MSEAFARSTDPETSQQAARTVNVTYLEGKVVAAIKALDYAGATQDDVVKLTGLPSNSVTPRFKPLLDKGVVYASGSRKGASGKSQRLLFLTPGVNVETADSNNAIVRDIERARAQQVAIKTTSDLIEHARRLVSEAVSLADEHNIPLAVDISDGMYGYYTPNYGWGSSSC
jgi:hypothetical protein